MASADMKKRKQPIPRIADNEVLGPFRIIVVNHVPYFVSDVNRQKITANLIKWLMGNSVNFEPKDIQKAIDFLFKRDHEIFLLLLSGEVEVGKFGPIFVPMVFFTQMPDVLNPDEFEERRTQAQCNVNRNLTQILSYHISKLAENLKWIFINETPVPRDYIASGILPGDVAERKVFRALQEYFEKNRDACLVLHSHSFLYNQNFQEKDFIVLNLTKGYVMVIEVKASNNGFPKAKQQLRDSKERVQAVFNSVKGMSDDWHYVGVCYIDAGDCDSTHPFVINGFKQLDLQIIESKVAQNRNQAWLPNQHIKEFVHVAKILLFEAQGYPHAPLTKEKEIEKIDEELDLASAPENIFFWTPEQLSIVQAMDIKCMLLMAYYGCGKTILLIERAEYLMRDPRNTVHFYINKVDSGLAEFLKLRFKDKDITIKTNNDMFGVLSCFFDFSSDGVNLTDHVIIDEAYMDDSQGFLAQLKKLQSQVSTLWVAVGYVDPMANFIESDFRKGLKDIHFFSPSLKHCLRNGQKIVELALKDESNIGLNCFGHQVENKSKSNVNDGLLHEIGIISPNPIKALQEAFKDQNHKKAFIVMENQGLEMSTLNEAIPEHDFVSIKDDKGLKKWIESSSKNQHLVLHDIYDYIFEVSGMEFQSMIYVSEICLKCGFQNKNSVLITRAKASLVIARYDGENCGLCKDASYPNLKWNKDIKKWEIEQDITLDQLPEESRKIFEKTSKLNFQIL